MKLNELRVGNTYLSTKWRVPVICDLTDFYELYEMADGAYDDPPVDEIFEPLPITKDALVELGFEYDKIAWFRETIMLDSNGDGSYAIWWNTLTHGRLDIDLKYVHELQDIYRSLMGEDLTYNIESNDED